MTGTEIFSTPGRALAALGLLLAAAIMALAVQTAPATAEICVWEGKAPACNGKCRPGYTLVERRSRPPSREEKKQFGKKCFTGMKAKCCKTSEIIIRGTAPFCNGRCKEGEERLGSQKTGPKGKRCRTGRAAICRKVD